MTNTETLPRIGNFALVACADGTYQVANLVTGTKSRPFPKARALRILKGVTR